MNRQAGRRLLVAATAAGVAAAALAGPAQAASLTVTTLSDDPAADGQCSLREAIANANADAQPSADCPAGSGADAIAFAGALAGTVPVGTQLEVTDPDGLTVDGADRIIVSGGSSTRVLAVRAGAKLELRHIEIAQGRVTDGPGGAVSNEGTLAVTSATVRDSQAVANDGGAIANLGGTVTISGSRLTGNRARGSVARGGQIYSRGGTVTVRDSTLAVSDSGNGGGVYNDGGTVTVEGSTLSANTAAFHGAGMFNAGTATIRNSTFSGNVTYNLGTSGGGLYNDGTATVTNSTFAGNTGLSAGGIGGQSGTTTLGNTIVASSGGGDCGGGAVVVDAGHNLIQDGSCLSDATSLSGDPSLGPLADNGGPTQTRALLAGSIAIDTGSDALASGLAFDQRGYTRRAGAAVDIGAYEYGSQPGYRFSGFLSPVDSPPVLNSTKAGSAIPVKFSLAGNQGLGVLAAGSPTSQPRSCPGAGAIVDPIEETTTSNSGLTYDALTDAYTYVWKTDKRWSGTCRTLTVTLADGQSYTADFQFK